MAKHGGNVRALAESAGRPADEILDFSANINPLGPPECVRAIVSRNLERIVHYPDPEAVELVRALARHYAAPPENIVAGNGSTEIIYAVPRALGRTRMVVPVPSYADYAGAARLAGMEVQTLPLDEAGEFELNWPRLGEMLRGGDAVILGQPNNPTGRMFDPGVLRTFAAAHADNVFVVDEAFAEFVPGYETLARDVPENVVVLCSLTKFYAIPGLRLGCAVAAPAMAERIRRYVQPWSVNVLAQAVGAAMLDDKEYAIRTRDLVSEQLGRMTDALRNVPGLHVYAGAANFLLVRIDRSGLNALTLADRLLARGIAVRVCDNFAGLDKRFFRVAVRRAEENGVLVEAIEAELGGRAATPRAKRRTPALMFQGTSSNAGKSVLTAAFCRILLQDGYRVAPFKAQNMSLNSFVTLDGGEMGRAQVVQAQACRLDPDVRMNPVLLKPSSDTGCQVIVRGRPVGNMGVGSYVDYKRVAFEAVRECYDSLASESDAVVLEGAGSPAEVNLKHHDIVNMKMAVHAGAPVLLVGDIDRGGVYASFVGTMEVLEEWERALIKGFVVNRFRGDASLLGPAHEFVLRHTGRPVLGVVPYLRELGLPEEDSVEFKSGALDEAAPAGEHVEVAVIDLPHISNFTDFDALRMEPDVHVRVVRSLDELDRPDAVILPGSKNVFGDLAYLRSTGLADRVRRLAADDAAEIVGVCGGFQMLGRTILDPHEIESTAGRADGLGLLPVTTTLAREKTLVRVTATHTASGRAVAGYEIHHGQTDAGGLERVLRHEGGTWSGAATGGHRMWGTYLHGIFDADEFRRWFVDRLRTRRGLEPVGRVIARYDIEPALDRLAGVVREALAVDKICRMMGLR